MMRVLVVGNDRDAAARWEQAVPGGVLAVPADPFPATPPELFALVNGTPRPDVVVLEPASALDRGLSLAESLTRDHQLPVVLVTAHARQVGLQALRAGVSDIIDPTADPAQLQASLERVRARGMTPVPPPEPGLPTARGQVIGVVSPKGGVGKTTVATNVAVGLARRFPGQVALIDMDVHFGDVASALNLTPVYSLPDMTVGPASRDAMALKSLLTRHETGLFVVPGSESPAAADAVGVDAVNQLLAMLSAEFAWVVVDTSPGLAEHTLAVLDHTDHVILVTSLDVPGVRGLRKELDTLNALNMGFGAQTVVLNFFDAKRGLTVADVAATIKAPVDIVIPQATVVPVSVNQRVPLLQSDLRDPVTRSLQQLVSRVAPLEQAAKHGLFGRRGKAEQ